MNRHFRFFPGGWRTVRSRPWLAAAWLFLTIQWVGFPACAAQVEDLYQAEAVVDGQTKAERNAAISKALKKVLVKVTGSRSVIRRPKLADDLRHASRYVQQYRYRLAPRQGEGQDGTPERRLQVSFDPQAIERLLRDKGLPVWGSGRPATLLWLGIEERGHRRFALPEKDQALLEAVQSVATDRGIPLLLPLLDLEDQSHLQVSDLWGGFESRISEASARYAADAVLTGRLRDRKGAWRGQWTLFGAPSDDWQSRGKTETAVAVEGLQQAIDRLAAQYAPVGGGEGGLSRLDLRVEEVVDLAAYGRVSGYLGSLDAVEQVTLMVAEPTAVVFGLRVRGGQAHLAQLLELGGMLERVSSSPSASVQSLPSAGTTGMIAEDALVPVLEYRLRP